MYSTCVMTWVPFILSLRCEPLKNNLQVENIHYHVAFYNILRNILYRLIFENLLNRFCIFLLWHYFEFGMQKVAQMCHEPDVEGSATKTKNKENTLCVSSIQRISKECNLSILISILFNIGSAANRLLVQIIHLLKCIILRTESKFLQVSH